MSTQSNLFLAVLVCFWCAAGAHDGYSERFAIYVPEVYNIYWQPYMSTTELIFREYLRRRSRIASSRSDENGQDQWPIFSKLRKVTGRSFPQQETGEIKDVSVTVSRPKCSSDTPGGFPQVTASFHLEESAHKSTCIFREKGGYFLKNGQFRRLS